MSRHSLGLRKLSFAAMVNLYFLLELTFRLLTEAPAVRQQRGVEDGVWLGTPSLGVR